MTYRVEEYLREDGSNPYKAWFNSLDPRAAAKVTKDGETLIVLFGGGTKRGQQREIDRAKALFAEYKARKKALSRNPGGQRKRLSSWH